MILREVTIGRASDCDIFLDPRCQYASGHHAVLYMDGGQLMYRDRSTNGTLINNVSVKGRAVPIQHGDVIMLAGKYQLSWNQIDAYFPPSAMNVSPQPRPVPAPQPVSAPAEPRLPSWSWGAFGIYGIWGLFNGCWWMLLVAIFLGWLWPLPNILFGCLGSKLAWEHGEWRDFEHFRQTQHSWDIAGIILFALNLVCLIGWICLLS